MSRRPVLASCKSLYSGADSVQLGFVPQCKQNNLVSVVVQVRICFLELGRHLDRIDAEKTLGRSSPIDRVLLLDTKP